MNHRWWRLFYSADQITPTTLFGLFKQDPIKKLEKQYAQLMEQAMQIQRSGDLKAYAVKIQEAEAVLAQLEAARKGAS